jgi:hypothetical protein
MYRTTVVICGAMYRRFITLNSYEKINEDPKDSGADPQQGCQMVYIFGPKIQFWACFAGPMEDVGILCGLVYGHLIFFMSTWCIWW